MMDLDVPDVVATSFGLVVGEALDTPAAEIPLRVVVDGPPMDFSCTPFGIPVVTARMAELLRDLAPADVQLVPGTLAGFPRAYSVVNVRKLECLDARRSKDVLVGGPCGGSISAPQYAIDPQLAQGHHLFRLANDPVVMVMSCDLLQRIERAAMVGPALLTMGDDTDQIMPGFALPA